MCLILFGYKVSRQYPLVLAANRDEFYNRPTAPMKFWKDIPSILGGRDLEQNGTWFGINKKGKFSALTNYRDPSSVKQNAPSRGELIVKYLLSKQSDKSFETHLLRDRHKFNGFNLLFGDINELFWFSNLKEKIVTIEPGIHGLSNKFLNTPWPKVKKGKQTLAKIIHDNINTDSLFSMLNDQTEPDISLLPDTGIGHEWEKILSPLYIQSRVYGTRSSTVMLIDQNDNIEITERTYEPENKKHYSDIKFVISPDR